MWWGIGTFFFVAILCVIVGVVMMKRRREYGVDDDGEDAMSDAEFRRIEGFDD